MTIDTTDQHPPRPRILGMGAVAVDEVWWVEKEEALGWEIKTSARWLGRRLGGQTANALTFAASLGERVGFAGILGDDCDSRFARQRLNALGVATSWLRLDPQARPIRSLVLIGPNGVRTVLYDLQGAKGAGDTEDVTLPEEGWAALGVALVDSLGVEGQIGFARQARRRGVAVVCDFESSAHPRFSTLYDLPDHLILSRDFAAKVLTESGMVASSDDPVGLIHGLHRRDQSRGVRRRLIAVTNGPQGVWSGRFDRDLHETLVVEHHRPPRIGMGDSTGCGDALRGAYAVALSRGNCPVEALNFAVTQASQIALRPPGHHREVVADTASTYLE